MLDAELKNAIKNVEPFQYLETFELNMLLAFCKTVSFTPGQLIFQQGKKCIGMYLVLQGEVSVSMKSLDRRKVEICTLEKGACFGEVCLIDKGVYVATISASTQTECLLVTTEYFDMLSVFYPETKYKITKAILEAVYQRLVKRIEEIKTLMKDSHMLGKSFFSDLIQGLNRSETINFEQAQFTQDMLRHLLFFDTLTDAEYQFLLDHSQLIATPTNYNLIRQDSTQTSSYFVIRGAVQSNVFEQNIVAKLSVSDPVALVAGTDVLNDLPALVSYTTCEKTVLLEISAQNARLIHQNNIQLWYKIYDAFSQSFIEVERATNKLLLRLHSELYNR